MGRIEIPDIGSALISEDFIHIWLYGTLKSMRDKSLNKYRQVKHNNSLIRAEQERWLTKLQLLGIIPQISELFAQSLSNGFKFNISVVVHRRIPIRDYKDLVVGFDHIILDAWTKRKIIKDDSMKYLDWNIEQLTKKESKEYERDLVFIMLSQSKIPYKP